MKGTIGKKVDPEWELKKRKGYKRLHKEDRPTKE